MIDVVELLLKAMWWLKWISYFFLACVVAVGGLSTAHLLWEAIFALFR